MASSVIPKLQLSKHTLHNPSSIAATVGKNSDGWTSDTLGLGYYFQDLPSALCVSKSVRTWRY